jgi:hypothetical protein
MELCLTKNTVFLSNKQTQNGKHSLRKSIYLLELHKDQIALNTLSYVQKMEGFNVEPVYIKGVQK